MNSYCKEEDNGYVVLEMKWIDKSYQKQLWALVKCPNPSHEPYWVWWNNFIRNYRCKKCYYEDNNMIDWDKYMAYNFMHENGYTMLNIDEFKDVDTAVYCKDTKGFIFKVSITSLRASINGAHKKFSLTKNNDYAVYNIKLFCELYRPDYEFISKEFFGVKELHWFRYNGPFLNEDKFSREFQTTIDGFINCGVLHPSMSRSKAEMAIEIYCIDNGINYIPEYRFEDCKDKYALPFDFYFPDYCAVCEAMGNQHYKPIDFFDGEDGYELRKKHDKIKYNYCKEHNIEYIEIPYTDFNNIEIILDKYFSQKNWKRIFGIAGKIGQLDQRGTVHTYQDYDNNAERVHIMLKDYQYTYVISDIDRVAKITFSA